MEIDELALALAGVAPDSRDPEVDWDKRGRLWSELATRAEGLLTSIVPGAFCTAQEWDNRLDYEAKLPDGTFVGEMISLDELTTSRLRETAERLRSRLAGDQVQFVNEIRPPIYIGGPLPKVR